MQKQQNQEFQNN